MMTNSHSSESLKEKNRRTATFVGFIVLSMVGLAFASVPLYDLFCRVTGFGGTTQVSAEIPNKVLDRVVNVKFNTDVNRNLPWSFGVETRSVNVKIGQDMLINYKARNTSDQPVAGTAIYNVTPPKVGKYFHKVQCFCFDKQVLQPNEIMNMPVLFYVDPAMDEDPYMDDVKTITLSYSYFKADSSELETAMDAYIETP